MKKKSYILITYGLAIFLGFVLFLTSERVQRTERLYDDIQDKLTTEREAYHILKTEWMYLNRPDRLEDLAVTHLKLAPQKPETRLTSVRVLRTYIPPTEPNRNIPDPAEVISLNNIVPSSGDQTVTPPPVIEISTIRRTPTSPLQSEQSAIKKRKISKQKIQNRNTSTAGVTFYQYMNRSESHPQYKNAGVR